MYLILNSLESNKVEVIIDENPTQNKQSNLRDDYSLTNLITQSTNTTANETTLINENCHDINDKQLGHNNQRLMSANYQSNDQSQVDVNDK